MPDFSTYEWRQLSPNPAELPSARFGHAMVWDGSRIIMFGGNVGDAGTLNNETWEFDGTDWNQLSPATSPSARFFHDMVFDGSDVILFGGFGGGFLNDTWGFDGTTWTNLAPATSPPTRNRHMMVWDGTRVLMMGGQEGGDRRDMWEFSGGTWTELFPAHHPSDVLHGGSTVLWRSGMTLVWDGARVLGFSGFSDSGGGGEFQTANYQETDGGLWKYQAADWTQVDPVTNPDARWGQGMCITDDDQTILMFGGNVSYVGGLGNAFDSETWQFDGADFSELVRATHPSARQAPLVWDDPNARGLLFGGGRWGIPGTDDILNDTWEFAPPVAPAGVYMPATAIPIE